MLNRVRRKTVVSFLAVLLTSGVAICLFVGKIHERRAFVSRVTAGYRYRCTLSSDWKLTQHDTSPPPGNKDEYTYASAPSPIREWITVHILHHPAPNKNIKNFILCAVCAKRFDRP